MKFTKAIRDAGWKKTSQGFEKTNDQDVHCVIKDDCDYNDDGTIAVSYYNLYVSRRIGQLDLIHCAKRVSTLMKVADQYRDKP